MAESTTIIVFPASELDFRSVDEHFEAQMLAAQAVGYECKLVTLSALEEDSWEKPLRWAPLVDECNALYRGWMLTPEHYETLAAKLASKNVTLTTTPTAYKRAHELPGWYDELQSFTPKTVELADTTVSSVTTALAALQAKSVFVRDYSKSVKHNKAASYIEDSTDYENALSVVENFVEARGTVAGRVLFREFEHFVGAEVRTWWRRGTLVNITAHPDTPEEILFSTLDEFASQLPENFSEKIESLSLPFVTADFVANEAGEWRMVELGDGGVSDVPSSADLETFMEALR